MNIEDKELEQFRRSQRRKDIIKNITIVFLLILLALTFFSRTIMNLTLRQVATHIVSEGESVGTCFTTSKTANPRN